MSTNWGARVVVGVKLTDVYTEKPYETSVTKYDPDTGKPYQKKVKKIARTFFGHKLPDVDEVNRNWDFLPKGLELLIPYYSKDKPTNDWIVGLKVPGVDVSSDNFVEWFDLNTVIAVTDRVEKAFEDASLKADIKVYLQLQVG